MTARGLTVEQRFWMKVDRAGEDECWLWTASTTPFGHGQLMVTPGHPARAHRLSWEFAHGPIPAGQVVCHRCDVPRCVNPQHLFLGEQAVNVADMIAKRRARGGRTPRPGSLHPNAKLSDADVASIRARRAAGETGAALAQAFHISPSQVSRICSGRRWSA